MNQTKPRNMGLECLRILSMFLIILLHSIDHSSLLENLIPGTVLYAWEKLFYSLCQVCVNCFVMISGYFLVNSKFRISKLVNIWIQVVFYSLGIKSILMVLGVIPFSAISLVSCLFPVLTGRYWFVTIYFGLYLLFPFLNILVKAMNRRQHSVLNILLIILMSLMISFHPALAGMNSGGGWGLAWFVTLYLIAAWLRRYGIPGGGKFAGWYAMGYLACSIIPWIATLATDFLGIPAFQSIVRNWYRYDCIFACLGSICLFCAFGAWNIRRGLKSCTHWIVSISGATFGVYLLHAHANVCIAPYWKAMGILSLSSHLWFPFYQLVLVAAIFAVCAVIELVRQKLFSYISLERLLVKWDAKVGVLWKGGKRHE